MDATEIQALMLASGACEMRVSCKDDCWSVLLLDERENLVRMGMAPGYLLTALELALHPDELTTEERTYRAANRKKKS